MTSDNRIYSLRLRLIRPYLDDIKSEGTKPIPKPRAVVILSLHFVPSLLSLVLELVLSIHFLCRLNRALSSYGLSSIIKVYIRQITASKMMQLFLDGNLHRRLSTPECNATIYYNVLDEPEEF